MKPQEIVIRIVIEQKSDSVKSAPKMVESVKEVKTEKPAVIAKARKTFMPDFYPKVFGLKIGEVLDITAECKSLGITMARAKERIGSYTWMHNKQHATGLAYMIAHGANSTIKLARIN